MRGKRQRFYINTGETYLQGKYTTQYSTLNKAITAEADLILSCSAD